MTTTVHVIRHMLFVQVCVCVCDLSTVSDPIMSKVKYSIGRCVPDSFFFSKSYSVAIVKGEGRVSQCWPLSLTLCSISLYFNLFIIWRTEDLPMVQHVHVIHVICTCDTCDLHMYVNTCSPHKQNYKNSFDIDRHMMVWNDEIGQSSTMNNLSLPLIRSFLKLLIPGSENHHTLLPLLISFNTRTPPVMSKLKIKRNNYCIISSSQWT